MNELEKEILRIVYSMAVKTQIEQESEEHVKYTDKDVDRKNLVIACNKYIKDMAIECGTCTYFHSNGRCHKNKNNPFVVRSGGSPCDSYRSLLACNGGKCERQKFGAEPCENCPYCDDDGRLP